MPAAYENNGSAQGYLLDYWFDCDLGSAIRGCDGVVYW